MQASIDHWNLWNSKEEYPVLVLHCSADDIEATEALHRLNKICIGLRGLGYKNTLAAVNNPDALKGQGTNFVIDIGTLLTLCSQVISDDLRRSFAIAWLSSLEVVQKEFEKKQEQGFQCRCGQFFKNEKVKNRHQKICAVLARDYGLLLRTAQSLKAIKGKGVKSDGKAKKENKGIRKDTKTVELPSKVSSKQKKGIKRKKVSDRIKGGRTKRIHNSKKKK